MDTLYTFWDNTTHYERKSIDFLGLMNLATKDQCWLGASPVAVSADPRSSSSILFVSYDFAGFDGIGCYSFWASRFRRTLDTMPFLHCVGVPAWN